MTGWGKGYRLRGAEVTVCKSFEGSVTVLCEGRELPVRQLSEGEEVVAVEDEKTVRGTGGSDQGGAALARVSEQVLRTGQGRQKGDILTLR